MRGEELDVRLELRSEELDLSFWVVRAQNKSTQTILFAMLMLVCSYLPFRAVLGILKSIYELPENSRKYSLVTIVLTNMWDTVLCILCFIFSFKDQVTPTLLSNL